MNNYLNTFLENFNSIIHDSFHLKFLTIFSPKQEKKEKREFTFRDLSEKTNIYLNFLNKKEIKSDDIILIILKESIDLFASFFAGIIIGGLPAFFAYPSPKQSNQLFLKSVENLIKFNKVKIIISYPEVIDILKDSEVLNYEGFKGYYSYDDINSNISNFNQENLLKTLKPAPREAFLQFSSGTTGAKKGVKISIEALLNQLKSYAPYASYNKKSVVVSWLPHYHDMGLIACMLLPFLERVHIVMMSPFNWIANPKILFQAITQYKGTHVWLPNFALGIMTRSINQEEIFNYELSFVKKLIICSEPALYETVSEFINKFEEIGLDRKSIINCYAMAENTYAMTSQKIGPINFIEVEPEKLKKFGIIELKKNGRPIATTGERLANIDIKILDKNGEFQKDNIIGEILIKSDCMLDCFHNNPIESESAFYQDYFKTGDLGFIHKNELYVVGRKKDMIIVGGENIYPQDIELILNEETGLKAGRNLVFGIEDKRMGTEKIIVLAETEDNQIDNINLENIRTKILNSVGVSVSEIILLPNMTLRKGTAGKISRHLNKELYEAGFFDKFLEDNSNQQESENNLINIIYSSIQTKQKPKINNQSALFSSGVIDSFGFTALISALEEFYKIRIPDRYLSPAYFNSMELIENTVKDIKEKKSNADLNTPKKSFFTKLKSYYKEDKQ